MSDPRPPARRRFLTFAATVPAALGFSTGWAQAQQAMIPTAPDMEGPYYIANMPVASNLNRFGKQGEVMRITGQIMDASSPDTPVAGAQIEIWQTDGRGVYHPDQNGDYADFNDADLDMRGTVIADDMGRFDVMSVFPKEYWPRPPHIHYRITADGFAALITQHYLDTSPSNRPHRTAQVIRDSVPAVFRAPIIYLARA